ncbi:MAG: 2-hydroxyacid dehydrogenase [Thermoplasmatota archaeon]
MDVLVTRSIPENGIKKLKEKYNVEVNEESRVLKKEEIIERVGDKDALLCLLTDEIDEDIIEAGGQLKVISNYAVGYDNIDVEAATERGITVTNTPGVLTDATADIAWALMMAAARNLAEGDRFVREDNFEGWDPMLMLGHEICGKTLGIIGMGNIGSAVAKRSTGFDMDIIYHSRSRNEEAEDEFGAEKVDLQTLLKESDIVSLHVPLTDETEGMIGWKEFKLMKDTAILVNTARGEVVDEEALIEALIADRIAGAGIDVYADEPYGANPDYYPLDNVVLTPHLGSASYRAREGMADMAAENLIAVLEGVRPDNIVNPDVL